LLSIVISDESGYLAPLCLFLFDEGPENDNEESYFSGEEDIDSDEEDIDESVEEDTMPPKKSSNAAKPSSKKNAAATSTTTTANDGMTSAPFSPFVLNNYKQISYKLGNGDSFTEVLLHGIGFSDTKDFSFNLINEGALSFTQAIPPTFFDKSPPDHATLSKAERRSLKNDSRTVQYANLARKIHSDLKYDIDGKGPFFSQPQVIVLEKKCESIEDRTGFASPTGHVVAGHTQYMTTYWCKLKEVVEDMQQRNKGNRLVIASGRSFDDDDDDDVDDSGSSSSGDESSVPQPRKGGGGGGGGDGKRGRGGADSKKGGSKKGGSSKSKRSHTVVKPELNIKSEMKGVKCAKREPGASCGVSDLIEILSQSSADDDY
jgi:hypothetical protein